jgi:hypothetical protein
VNKEPVISAAIIAGAIGAVLTALVSLGVIQMTPEQQAAILGAVVAVLPIALGIWARGKVTPLENPRDDTGTALVRPDGRPPVVE